MTNVAATQTPHTWLNWTLVLSLAAIWGAAFLSIEIALGGFPPLAIAAGRIVLAALILWMIARWRGLRLPGLRAQPRLWLFAAGFGILSNALPFSLLAWAQQSVTSGFVGITMALVPLFTLVFAHLLLADERLTPFKTVGFLLGLAGVVTLIGTDGLGTGSTTREVVARLACLASTVSYAMGGIVTRRCPPVDPVQFSVMALAVGSAVIVPIALIGGGWPQAMPPASAWMALVYLGVMPTAVATLIIVKVIRSAGPTFLSQTNYQVPLWSVALGTLILNEPLPPEFVVALALILSGLAISRLRGRRRAR